MKGRKKKKLTMEKKEKSKKSLVRLILLYKELSWLHPRCLYSSKYPCTVLK